MNIGGLARTLLLFVVAGGLLIASGVVDVHVSFRDNVAEAIDLFGEEEPETSADPAGAFWKEGTEAPQATPPQGAPPSFAELAELVSPAVVNIQTSRTLTASRNPGPRHPLEEFFGGQPFGDMFRGQRDVPSLGTGFVISSDGYIVTNNHVIEDVDKIEVHFSDDDVLEAEIVGRDPKTDIALIRVKSEDALPHLPLGDSDAVRPGDWVIAIGNPFGLAHTVTAGIVSAKHRRINDPRSEARRFDDFIQTDAAINPGNSGGPLMNLRGEVVGINTAINPRANTIGFAVPVNMAKGILPQLRASGHVSRGWLGVYIQEVNEDIASHLELDDEKGALVSKVEPGGPAADGGVRSGDVIVGFNGSPVDDMEELPRLVAAAPVGSKAELVVVRKGKRKTLEIQLGELDEGEKLARAGAPGGDPSKASAYGLQVQELTPDIAERLGLEADAKGLVVVAVEPESPAAEASLQRGDVILEVNQEAIEGVGTFADALEDTERGALLLVRRGQAEIFVPLKKKTG